MIAPLHEIFAVSMANSNIKLYLLLTTGISTQVFNILKLSVFNI